MKHRACPLCNPFELDMRLVDITMPPSPKRYKITDADMLPTHSRY